MDISVRSLRPSVQSYLAAEAASDRYFMQLSVSSSAMSVAGLMSRECLPHTQHKVAVRLPNTSSHRRFAASMP